MICTPHQYYSGHQFTYIEMGGARNMYGETRGAYRVLVGRAEGKTPLGRTRRRWKDNKMDLQ